MENFLMLGVGAFFLYEFFSKGSALASLRFVAEGIDFDITNPLTPIAIVTVLVQNPTNGTLTLNSLAGNFFINGQIAGNVSDFIPAIVAPNSQTPINLQLRINDLNLISIIMNYINGSSSGFGITIQATANISGIPTPVSLSFNPVPA